MMGRVVATVLGGYWRCDGWLMIKLVGTWLTHNVRSPKYIPIFLFLPSNLELQGIISL
jgi:hypothetical protein